MSIREKVARAINRTTTSHQPLAHDGRLSDKQAAAAIAAFLEAAAEQGWHMRPDEATEEMGEEWAKLALERIQRAVEGDMQTVGMVKGAMENYRVMSAAAPKFELGE